MPPRALSKQISLTFPVRSGILQLTWLFRRFDVHSSAMKVAVSDSRMRSEGPLVRDSGHQPRTKTSDVPIALMGVVCSSVNSEPNAIYCSTPQCMAPKHPAARILDAMMNFFFWRDDPLSNLATGKEERMLQPPLCYAVNLFTGCRCGQGRFKAWNTPYSVPIVTAYLIRA